MKIKGIVLVTEKQISQVAKALTKANAAAGQAQAAAFAAAQLLGQLTGATPQQEATSEATPTKRGKGKKGKHTASASNKAPVSKNNGTAAFAEM